MARNEEKQQGKLNRLWLQKEREEGRIKDVLERRPKLSTLNSASSVKKWIPSIKREIEYYLQQSQLSHYPERKIAEFQLCIEGLEKEYKRFLSKLRALDPSCKHQPWTPRAYTKRRESHSNSASNAKKLRSLETCKLSETRTEEEDEWSHRRTGSGETSFRVNQEHLSQSEFHSTQATHITSHCPIASESGNAAQDQPLSFDQTRLAVALAGCRGPVQPGSSPTPSIARVLLSGLPNLHSSPLGQAIAAKARDTASTEAGLPQEVMKGEGRTSALDIDCERNPAGGEKTGTPCSTKDSDRGTGHILGLSCYSSSDEESNT